MKESNNWMLFFPLATSATRNRWRWLGRSVLFCYDLKTFFSSLFVWCSTEQRVCSTPVNVAEKNFITSFSRSGAKSHATAQPDCARHVTGHTQKGPEMQNKRKKSLQKPVCLSVSTSLFINSLIKMNAFA